MNRAEYRASQPPSAFAAVADPVWTESATPEPTQDKSSLIDRAYDEYCRRRAMGETPDPDAFCRGFPFQSSLRRFLEAERFLQEDTLLFEQRTPTRWPKPGAYFLGFLLHRELGRGAFARVFLATEPALGHRQVAVKIALQGGAEAETLGRLEHPNIVSVHSVQKDPLTGLTAVCMPYLGGANLCHLLDHLHSNLPGTAAVIQQVIEEARHAEEASQPPRWTKQETFVAAVARIGEQLAEGLASIHAQGICHRDLKPSNVLLATDGRAMLLDFNLSFDARASEQQLGGTLPYMSPEQLAATDRTPSVAAAAVDARSDLFSLGVLLYELLSGAHPFGPVSLKLSADEVRVYLRQRHQEGPRPLRQTNPRVNKRLALAVERCLAVNAADRPQSALELAAALRSTQPMLSRARRWVSRRVRAVAAIGLLVVAAGVAGAVGTYNLTATPPPITPQELADKGREFYQKGQYGKAAECFDEALKGDEKNWELTYALGRAYLQQGGMDSILRAEKYFERADELFSATRQGQEHNGGILASRAYCMNRIGRQGDAVVLYTGALAAGYETAELQNNLGYSYLLSNSADSEREKNAQIALGRALQIKPRLQAAYFNRAELHAEQVGRISRLQPGSPYGDMEKAIQIGPQTPSLYFAAARLHAMAAQVHGKRAGIGHKIGVFRIGNSAFETAVLIADDTMEAEFHHAQAVRYAREALRSGFKREVMENHVYLRPMMADVGEPQLTNPTPEIDLRLREPVSDP